MVIAASERQGRLLAYATILWNVVEGVVSIAAGSLAGSASLVGFGIDSFIESLSAVAILWRLHGKAHERERIAQRLVAMSLFVLAVYVGFECVKSLVEREAPEASYLGIGITALSAVVMPTLAKAKRKVAMEIDSGAMHSDSKQSDLCAYLSIVLLVGLALNAAFGWWWADPVAGLGIVAIILKEGWSAWQGDGCGCR